MKKFSQITSGIVLFCFFACSSDKKEKNNQQQPSESMDKEIIFNDPHSFSKPDEAVVTHLNWEAKVNFEKQSIKATATYTIENKKKVDSIFLDSKGLNIFSIQRDDFDGELDYTEHADKGVLGNKLAIPISEKTKEIRIEYETGKQADALQFLSPQQTADKTHPFLFTQSQAILARSWIPCQDSPGVRFTYEAKVEVPKGMMALMSAENPSKINQTGVYHFRMDQAIPSYLMALAVGHLEYQSLGRNTGVFAEPSLIDAAAYEFAEMQSMLDAAEHLYGDYRWGQYDVIVLPPSFPFGGMENPRLTFATPTIIAGDRSLTALIAHELAHSWSGNLVTNANWEDIWLNEGFTVYFENRIMEEIYGKDFANMLALLSHQDLLEEIESLTKKDRLEDTRLKVNLSGRNPDEGLTGIPYDKGYFFLRLIEETVGRDKWDAFLKSYFNKYAFQVMTTDRFLEELDHSLLDKNPDWKEKIKVDQWVFGTGLPENCPKIQSNKFSLVEKELQSWEEGENPQNLKTEKWLTAQWLHFVRSLPAEMTAMQINELDRTFDFTHIGNSEILAAWFEKIIPNNYEPAKIEVEKFLIRFGRRKFLMPIYEAILKSEAGRSWAVEIYEKARPNYHAVSRESVDQLLKY